MQPNFCLSTPVAFLVFNRPGLTNQAFAEIANAKPTKLLVVADGPRPTRVGEAERVRAVREVIDRVDWDCEVLTNFSEVNLGCKQRISTGIDWIFENVEEAIILEDDCVPDPTFFRFCEELLERYRNDSRVGMISGDNFVLGSRRNTDSYYFSRFVHIWGWATWRDRWVGTYDVAMSAWPKIRSEDWLLDILGNRQEADEWTRIFDKAHRGEIDTWDYQWVFANWIEGRSTVLPSVNLVTNIGFGADATHTTKANALAERPRQPIGFPLIHPAGLIRDTKADGMSSEAFRKRNVLQKVQSRIAQIARLTPTRKVTQRNPDDTASC